MSLNQLRYFLWFTVAGLLTFESAWAEFDHLGNSNRGVLGNQQFQAFQAAQGGGGGGAGGGGGSYRGVSEAAKESIKSGEKAREEIKGGVEKANESLKEMTESFLSNTDKLQVEEATEAVKAVAAAQPDPQPTNIGSDIVDDIVAATQKLSETQIRTIQTIGQMFTAPPAQSMGAGAGQAGGNNSDRITSAAGLGQNRGQSSQSLGSILDHNKPRGIGVEGASGIFRGVSSDSYNMPTGVRIPQVEIDSEQ